MHSCHPSLKEQTGGSTGAPFSPLPISQTSEMERDGQEDAGNTARVGVWEVCGFGPSTPHPNTTSRATAGQTAWGCAAPPRQGWDIKAGSAGACQPGFVSRAPINASVQTAFAALSTCIPDWSRPGPSCIPGLEEAEGPGPFVLPKSGLRTMTC